MNNKQVLAHSATTEAESLDTNVQVPRTAFAAPQCSKLAQLRSECKMTFLVPDLTADQKRQIENKPFLVSVCPTCPQDRVFDLDLLLFQKEIVCQEDDKVNERVTDP